MHGTQATRAYRMLPYAPLKLLGPRSFERPQILSQAAEPKLSRPGLKVCGSKGARDGKLELSRVRS